MKNSYTKTAEKLIDLVLERPCLYDTAHEHYRNNLEKERAWQEIVDVLDLPVHELKKRWKNLKDCYAKYLRARRSKDKTKYRSWPWAHKMTPLQKFIEVRTGQRESISTRQESKGSYDSGAEMPSIHSRNSPKITITQHPSPNPQSNQNINYNDYDDIDLLFLSYAKTIKKFFPERQAIVKYKIATLILEAEMDSLGKEPVEIGDTSTENLEIDENNDLLVERDTKMDAISSDSE